MPPSRRTPLPVLAVAALLATLRGCAAATDASAWRQMSIYEIMTDRFNNPEGTECVYSSTYCGGTWAGIADQVDYLAAANFAAVWITPITANEPQGYHGYWPVDL